MMPSVTNLIGKGVNAIGQSLRVMEQDQFVHGVSSINIDFDWIGLDLVRSIFANILILL